jgi:hypothetical protein
MPLATFILAALWALSGGLTGTWTGNISQRESDGSVSESSSAFLQLNQQDGTITGRVGASSDAAHPIEKAVLSGEELKFATHYSDPGSGETVNWWFDLKVKGNTMEGVGTGSRGDHSWTVEIKLSRREMVNLSMPSTGSPECWT